MRVEEIGRQIQLTNYQIKDIVIKMKKIKKETEEAEEAYDNAQKFHEDFSRFIAKAGSHKENLLECLNLQSVVVLAGKITDLLTGTEYCAAENKFAEINAYLKTEIVRLDRAYEECREEARRLEHKIGKLRMDYKECQSSGNQGE